MRGQATAAMNVGKSSKVKKNEEQLAAILSIVGGGFTQNALM